jgi:hypothetical protein
VDGRDNKPGHDGDGMICSQQTEKPN